MNKLVKKIQSNFSEDSFDQFYELIQTNKWISIYVNGQKYFIIFWKGKFFYLSEFYFSLILCVLVYMGILGIRKLCKRFKVRKKMVRLLKKLRGGSNPNSILELVDENDILHYEDGIPDMLDYNPIPGSSFTLDSKEKLIKSILKKCLKPGHFYKITNRGVLEIVDKMLQFRKKDTIKLISYDVLALSLVIALKPISRITYEGTSEVLKKFVSRLAIEHLPLIVSIFTAGGIAFQVDLNRGLSEISVGLVQMLINSAGAFKAAELLRSTYLIDCSDYVKQLSQTNLKELPHVETLSEGDSSSSSSSKNLISYTREEPTRHDAFVSTSPNQQLHYQKDSKIETLDGEIRDVSRPKGKSLEYVKTREPAKVIESAYIPLEQRTRTLSDVRSLDSTADRESASKITQTILEEQLKASLIREAILNGE